MALVVCLVNVVYTALLVAGWECQGTPNPVYPNWHTNTVTWQTADVKSWTRVKGDHESADFRCVCHEENANPLREGESAWGECAYYGPLWYWYAHNDVNYYHNDGYGGHWDHYKESWIYTD